MIPLWAMAIVPVQSMCGWAFSGVGLTVGSPTCVRDTRYTLAFLAGEVLLKPRDLALGFLDRACCRFQ